MRLELSTRILRPVDDVFAVLADVDRFPEWIGAVVTSEKTSSGPVGVGTTIRQAMRIVGQPQEGTVEITDFVPPHRLEQRFSTGAFSGTMRYALSPQHGATELVQEVEAQFDGPMKPSDEMLAGVLKSEFQADLQRLKMLLEKEGSPSATSR